MIEYVSVAIIVVALTTYIILLATSKKQRQFSSLPGPKAWPLIGNTLQMSTRESDRYEKPLMAWAKHYGKMFRINIFNADWIVLNDIEDIHEMLIAKGRNFSKRSKMFRYEKITCGYRSISLGDPSEPHWLPMKKAAYRALHQHGTGLNRMEEVLVPLAQEFVSDVKQYDGREVDIHEALYNFVAKVSRSFKDQNCKCILIIIISIVKYEAEYDDNCTITIFISICVVRNRFCSATTKSKIQ
jgi:hypothetical protein